MKHSLPSLDSLKAFEATARLLSFSQAADELCVSKGAVSYQVKKLEQSTGLNLFKRTTRHILLTDDGQVLYRHTLSWFDQLHQTLAQLRQQQAKHLIIAVSTYTAVRWLSPKMVAYQQAHPHQQVMLQHRVNDLSPRSHAHSSVDVDVSIRWQMSQEAANEFIPAPMFPVISPHLLASLTDAIGLGNSHGMRTVLSTGNLSATPWNALTLLTEHRQQDLWQEWNCGQPYPNSNIMIEDANVRVQAAIDGQGLILADQLMQAELDAGVLIPISEDVLAGVGYGIHSHSHAGQAFVDWLKKH